jgi:hypothetical protein
MAIESAQTYSEGQLYTIRMRGTLDHAWAEHLSWVEVQVEQPGTGDAITVLHGRLPDQSALFGILNTLFGLGLELIDVHEIH